MDAHSAREELVERLLRERVWLATVARELVRDPGAAEDIAQEAWAAALARPPSGPLRPWLGAVVRKMASLLRRGGARRRWREERAARPEAVACPAELLERVEVEERLARELRALDEPFRSTLLWRFIEGQAAAEIARRQGIPEGTVRWRTKRGLAELRVRLERSFGEGEAFLRALAPLVRSAGKASSVGSLVTGGIWMTAKGWGFVAAAGLLGWFALRVNGGGEPAPVEVVQAAADASVSRAGHELEVAVPRGDSGAAIGERTALESAPTARPARVRVIGSGGLPLGGARVEWRMPGTEETHAEHLDGDGFLAFVEPPGTIELALERPQGFPHVRRMAVEKGDQDLVVPDGEVLGGRLLVDGGVPRRPLVLELYRAHGYTASSAPDHESLFEATCARARTDMAGRFEFLGLEARPHELVMPIGHCVVGGRPYMDPDRRLKLTVQPGRGQVFELERFPSVHGFVRLDDGMPTAASLDGRATWKSGTTMDFSAAANASGEFEQFLRHEWRELRIEWCAAPVRIACAEGTFLSAEFPDGELGELRLPPASGTTLRVVDPDGLPVAGAFTSLGGAPTDSEGRTELVGGTAGFEVAAQGYSVASVPPGEPAGELRVTLEPAPDFGLLVCDALGQPVPEARVRVEAERELFDGLDGRLQDGLWRSEAVRSGRFSLARNRKGGGSDSEFECDSSGRLRLGGILAGVPFRMAVLSWDRLALQEEWVPALGASEARSLVLRVPSTVVQLRGRARDDAGQALPGVRVSVPAARVHSHVDREFCTSDQGSFSCYLLLAPEAPDLLPVTFERRGFLPREIRWDRRPHEPIEVRLDSGLSVQVSVVDPRGASIIGGEIDLCPVGTHAWSGAVPGLPGRFLASGLTPGLHEFKLRLGGRVWSQQHSTLDPELVFRIERPGRVEVHWSVSASQLPPCWFFVRLTPAEPGLRGVDGDGHSDAREGEVLFPAVSAGTWAATLLRTSADGEIELARERVEVRPGETARVELRARL